jgi:membrane protein DedA with SNARE-associated domain
MFVNAFEELERYEPGSPNLPFKNFGTIMITGILMAVITFAALIIFIIHVINNKSLPDNERIIWVLVFIFAGMIGIPIYWFMRGIKYDPNNYQDPLRKFTT